MYHKVPANAPHLADPNAATLDVGTVYAPCLWTTGIGSAGARARWRVNYLFCQGRIAS